jgi:phospholipid/cholesterol/gamma-HCH transport system substrate-binding protein
MRFGNEARVGFVVILALVLGAVGYFFLRGVGLGADTYTIRLDGAATIATGNDVTLQGIKIGTVKKVSLDPETQRPLITIAIQKSDPPFKLLKSYRYAVTPSGLIGENYIDIRGPFDPNGALYAANDPNQIIPGIATQGIAGLTDNATRLSADLGKTLQKVNVTLERINKGVLSYDNQRRLARTLESTSRLARDAQNAFGPQGFRFEFGDRESQRYLRSTLAGTSAASIQASRALNEATLTARSVRGLVGGAGTVINRAGTTLERANGFFVQAEGIAAENRGGLKELLTSFRLTATNIAGLTETLSFLTSQGGFRENAQITMRSLRRTAENVEATTASVRRVSDDPELNASFRATVAALRTSTESLSVTARSIESLVGDETARGQLKTTLATLSDTAVTLKATTENLRVSTEGFKNVIGDPQVQADLKAIPTELRATLESSRAVAERINALLGGRRRRSTETGAGGASTSSRRSGPSFTLRRLGDADASGARTFGDADFRAELFGAPFRAGLANIGEDTGITLQTGRFLGDNAALRYGIFRDKLGVGLDYDRGKFHFEGDLYDPNRRSYALYGGYDISPQVSIIAGVEKGRGVRSGSIGVRLSP